MTTLKKATVFYRVAVVAALALISSVAFLYNQPGLAQDTAPTNQPEEIVPITTSFRPPRNPRRRRGYSTTAGTRPVGCSGIDYSKPNFVTLGPSATVGQTSSARPQFTWYSPPSNVPYSTQFHLLAPNEAGTYESIHKADLSYSEGIATYALPDDVAALSTDTEYLWQVIIICDAPLPNSAHAPETVSPLPQIEQELAFEIIPASQALQQKLEAATTPAERALAYGEAGLWYDAIAQVASANDPESRAVRRSLLEDLAQIESADASLYEDISRIAELSVEL
jgi:hypothetical protein